MISHTVLIRSDEKIEPVIEELKAFCVKFDGVVSFNWGKNVSIEPHVAHGFDHAFVVNFTNETSRDRYVADPEHKAIGSKLVSHCPNGLQDIVVFDLAIEDK